MLVSAGADAAWTCQPSAYWQLFLLSVEPVCKHLCILSVAMLRSCSRHHFQLAQGMVGVKSWEVRPGSTPLHSSILAEHTTAHVCVTPGQESWKQAYVVITMIYSCNVRTLQAPPSSAFNSSMDLPATKWHYCLHETRWNQAYPLFLSIFWPLLFFPTNHSIIPNLSNTTSLLGIAWGHCLLNALLRAGFFILSSQKATMTSGSMWSLVQQLLAGTEAWVEVRIRLISELVSPLKCWPPVLWLINL